MWYFRGALEVALLFLCVEVGQGGEGVCLCAREEKASRLFLKLLLVGVCCVCMVSGVWCIVFFV